MLSSERIAWLSGLVFLAGTQASCAKTHRVYSASNISEADVVHYALPRTVVKVVATVSVSTIAAPPCASEAEALGIPAPKFVKGKYFTVHDVEVETFGEPDPGRLFAVELGSTGASALQLTLDRRGILTGGSSESKDEYAAAALGIAKSAAEIAMDTLFGAGTSALAVPVDDERCRQARGYLVELRRALVDVHSNRGAADPKDVLEWKIAKLSAMEKKAESIFNGVIPGSPVKIQCEVRPSEATEFKLFDYTAATGAIASPSTADVTCEIPPEAMIPPSHAVAVPASPPMGPLPIPNTNHDIVLHMSNVTGIVPATTSAPVLPTKDADRSFAYYIPRLTVVGARETKRSASGSTAEVLRRFSPKSVYIAQFGALKTLPRMGVSGSAKLSVTLDAENGALLAVTTNESSADLGGGAATIAETVTNVADSVRGRKSAEAEELEALLQRQAILEAKVAIEAAEAALK